MRFKQLYEQEKPTEAQIQAGNYKKRKVAWNGMTISIENDAGSYREGTDSDGTKWRTKMYYDYGYINRTMAIDGDQIDIFMGPDLKSEIVFVVNQINDAGNFDEHKIIARASTKDEAEKIYLKNYEKGWNKYSKQIQSMSIDEFKHWLKNGNTKKHLKESESNHNLIFINVRYYK